jgi:hypothetical protein
MKRITLCVTLIAITGAIHAQKMPRKGGLFDPDKKFTVEALLFDLAILKNALVKTHPGLYWYQPEKKFEEAYANLKSSIKKPMTELEFYAAITPFVASIRCSHTGLMLSKAFDAYFTKNKKFFPFSVRIIEGKIYLIKNYSNDSTISIGSEIVAINGMSADGILHFMSAFGWSDGFTRSNAMIEMDFETLFSFYYNSEKYVLNTLHPEGYSQRIEVNALESKIFDERYSKYNDPDPSKKYKPFRFHLIDSLSAAIIRIDEFDGKGYQKFLSNSFKTLKNKQVKNLIIDLRGNGGGEDHYGKLLYSYIALKEYKYYDRLEVRVDGPKDSIFRYGKMPMGNIRLKFFYAFRLKKVGSGKYNFRNNAHENLTDGSFKPKPANFKGNVYVLVDDWSFSATTEFCAVAQSNKRAKFIGRESGGGYCGNTSGADFLITLPNTKMRATIPLVRYYSAVDGSCGGGIYPDYPLKKEVRDYIQNSDSDLRFALDLIKRSRQ